MQHRAYIYILCAMSVLRLMIIYAAYSKWSIRVIMKTKNTT